ncbi:hypothetical protein ACFLRY_00065 [Bacteroidota bacterium]
MKKLIIVFSIILFSGLFSNEIFAGAPQEAPPPPNSHGSNENQGPSDAPIAGGLFILLGLGGAYGGYKFYQKKKRKLTE